MERTDIEKILAERLEALALAGVTHMPRAARLEASDLKEKNNVAKYVPEKGLDEVASKVTEKAESYVGESSPPSADCNRFVSRPISQTVDLRLYDRDGVADQAESGLVELAKVVAACCRCSVLSRCRKQTVFGVGSPTARLCFFGEAPGADEDQIGEPFVGAAGQLLDRILAACHLSRDEVYILNTIKCRPPDNRNPSEEEIANCWEYAEKQLAMIRPKFICCLGRVAAQTLLKTTEPIGRLRGAFYRYRESQVMVTYHPAYLLRTPSAKKQTWDDMKMLMAAMGSNI